MKRLLILFANGFPYGISEPFLENEVPLYGEYFDHVLLSTACRRGEAATRQVDETLTDLLCDYTLHRDVRSILETIPCLLRDKLFYRELKLLWKRGFSMHRFYRLLTISLCGNHQALQVWRWLRARPEYDELVLYGYWLHIPAYGAVRLKNVLKKGRAVSRTHGFDLYAERYPDGYLPFQQQLVEQLDEVAPISMQGAAYLKRKYGDRGNISVYYLGAKAHEAQNPVCPRKPFRIVTCSRTVPLKRLPRVVDALCRIPDRGIEWTHIGGGEAQTALEQYARDRLPGNVRAVFTGTLPNPQIYEIYAKQPFHLFLNVSETEGLPVSIMEVMSFGIPVIATDVGGTAELVADGENGYLLARDFSDEQLAAKIEKIAALPEEAYQSLRLCAEKTVEEKFNAEKNYRRFIEEALMGNGFTQKG